MCGRYFFGENIDISKYLKIIEKKYDQLTLDLFAKGEIAPSQVAVSLTENDVNLMRWGYQFNQRNLINTRIESIRDQRFYDEDYSLHKCVLPASGFYEWDEEKKRYYITLNDKPIYLAGLYQVKEDQLAGFSIITKAATTTRHIHNRAPIVFTDNEVNDYLNNKLTIEEMIRLDPAFNSQCKYENITLF